MPVSHTDVYGGTLCQQGRVQESRNQLGKGSHKNTNYSSMEYLFQRNCKHMQKTLTKHVASHMQEDNKGSKGKHILSHCYPCLSIWTNKNA